MIWNNIIIPKELQKPMVNQLHTSHMGLEKMRLLACKPIYWLGINADIEVHIKTMVQHIFDFSRLSLKRD